MTVDGSRKYVRYATSTSTPVHKVLNIHLLTCFCELHLPPQQAFSVCTTHSHTKIGADMFDDASTLTLRLITGRHAKRP